MRESVSRHLLLCTTYQSSKSPNYKVEALSPITVSNRFELVGWDLVMGPFPTSLKGNKYILVIAEYLTRWCEATPLPNNSAKTVAEALLHKLVFNHSCPEQLLSDQGKQFHGEVMRTLTQFLGINQLFTSPYHPQENGLTERLNKTIKQIITTFVDPLHQDWDEVLPFVVHAYNTSVQASTQISPFRSLYGRNPRLPPEIRDPSTVSTLGDAMDWWLSLQQRLPVLRHAAQHNLRIVQLREKRHYDN